MSLIGSFVKSRSVEDPLVPLTSTTLLQWLGGTSSNAGELVSETSAYGLTAYYRAVAIMAGTCAGLPLKVYRKGTRERVAVRTVLDSPNARQRTPFMFWQTMFANGASWGRMLAIKDLDPLGITRQLWPVHPSRVGIREVDRTEANPEGLIYLLWTRAGDEQQLTSRNILHIPYLAPSGVTGLSPLQVAAESIGTGIAAEKSAGKFFANGSQLSGLLSTDSDLTQTQSDRLKARWKEKVAGPAKAGDIAVLDNGARFQPISIPPRDAELLASRKWTVTEIARLFGLPPHLLGDVEKSTSWGTGIEQQMIGFVQFTLKPWLDLVEQAVTIDVLPGGLDGPWFSEYSIDGLLRGDSASRAALYASGIQNGWLNRNEARAHENLPPVDGLDAYLMQVNMAGGEDPAKEARAIAEIIQKIYLGVGAVITAEEARKILQDAGLPLSGGLPDSLKETPNVGS